jgi:hypothetical protein
MDIKDKLVAGTSVLALGASSVVGGNIAIDKATGGAEKRRDETVQAVLEEIMPIVDARIYQLVPKTSGSVVTDQPAPSANYRNRVPK